MGASDYEDFARRNALQRHAILEYIREVTGKSPQDVTRDEQNRLALEWVENYGGCFEDGS